MGTARGEHQLIGNVNFKGAFLFCSVLQMVGCDREGTKGVCPMIVNAPMLLAIATVLTAISNVIWSLRRKR